MTTPVIKIIRPGDTTKPHPFAIFVIANPSLESPWNSGSFVVDPIMTNATAFDACVRYIENSLFGLLPNQTEHFLSDPALQPHIRLVSLFVTGLSLTDTNSLVAEDEVSDILVARRTKFLPFLSRYNCEADIAFGVSGSKSHSRASAWFTSDDDQRPGVHFTLDGMTFRHRYWPSIPGTVGIHSSSTSLTALHEFGHALSSYTNGGILDLYVDSPAALNVKPRLNIKFGRPIPANFATYNGASFASDLTRDRLGYPPDWRSYHCELHDPARPAVMDNYWQSPDGVSEHCLHDKITRQFLIDRLHAKISR
jgi:hypothetical protein